jgi:hypothetical protein
MKYGEELIVQKVTDMCYSLEKCQNNCNNHGKCDLDTMQCKCDIGYKGEFCEFKDCTLPCLNNGKCIDGACFCEIGWTGQFCERSKLYIKIRKLF